MTAPRSRRSKSDVHWGRWMFRWRRQQEVYLPQREARFHAMLSMLEVALPPEFEAVDLASGPGAISTRILDQFPRARCTAVDYHPVLLRLGREVNGTRGDRLRWVDADLRRSEWVDRLPVSPVDAVLSTTALHWLKREELAVLLRQVRSILKPGGLFLNGDHMAYPAGEARIRELTRTARTRASAQWVANGHGESWDDWWAAIEKEPALATEVAEAHRRYPNQHGREPEVPLATHIRLLRAAGFSEVDTIWQQYDNRVLLAIAGPPRRSRAGRRAQPPR
jgi:SAM-dependent methyltransferase